MSKKLLALTLVLVLCFGLALELGVAATQGLEVDMLTVEKYINFLEAEATLDREATETLIQFKHLDREKQEKLVRYLEDPAVFTALMESTEQVTHHTTELYGGDVVIETTVQIDPLDGIYLPTKTYYRRATITHEQRIYGILITRLQSWVNYSHNGKKVLAVQSNGAGARNFNIAVSISSRVNKPWKTSSRAYSTTTWKGYAIYKGFGIRIDKEQQVWGDYRNRTGGYLKNI